MSDYTGTCAACERELADVYPYTCHLWEPRNGAGHRAHYVCNPCRKTLLQMEPTGVIKCGPCRRLCPNELTEDQRLLVAIGSQP